ncbi:hypothetical protein QFC21_002784 [Naganishia friedmannii]|uniref:Uncharacterized protein n=1 Tax=Naganishia friedmannii TaxID=89922 RepID=A0ACC2VSI1_9TREE|nr:hypothetical protein QFC21_002784 [Naganishia friedmannii]
MDELGLPTSFGRAPKAPKQAKPTTNTNSPDQQPQNNVSQRNNGRGGSRRGGAHGQGARTSPYPAPIQVAGNAASGADMQVDGFEQGHHTRGRGGGRGRGRGAGGGRGRGNNRNDTSDPRGPPPAHRSGFSKQQTETGMAFISDSFFEDPWAGLPLPL